MDIKKTNLENKQFRLLSPYDDDSSKEKFIQTVEQYKPRAISICFSDIEGRLHILDYDTDFLMNSYDNLTFDGSSIRGFTGQSESDLRLGIDWGSMYLIPWSSSECKVNKLMVFGTVQDADGSPYISDFRARLKSMLKNLRTKDNIVVNMAAEIEGFLFKDKDAEKKYYYTRQFEFVNSGGYFDTLPQDSLRTFIDTCANIQRISGFENEKDHPEVAPSQFELNWKYTEALAAADQIQLYKLICKRVARNMGYTASFLPKPVVGVNGNGMHTNISFSQDGKNIFYDAKGENGLSKQAWNFISGILNKANDTCLICNSSVNAYRRLDPHMEAPNEIKVSTIDRGSMIRIPLGNEKSARVELRTVSPDANPYLMLYAVLHAGLESDKKDIPITTTLPENIYESMELFEESLFVQKIMNIPSHLKYLRLKQESANRCPKALGNHIKVSEIMFHHEVTNQYLWNQF